MDRQQRGNEMNFTDLVTSAEARASERVGMKGTAAIDAKLLAAVRMTHLRNLLADQLDAIRALPAVVTMSDARVTLQVAKDGRDLRIEVFFETEIWKAYFLQWETSTTDSFDDGHGKASTAEDAICMLAEMIGRHLAGAHPTDDLG